MEYYPDYRKLIFRELGTTKLLSSLRVEPPSSLKQSFFVPLETNSEVLSLFAKALSDEAVTKETNV